jgi:hypothetical protein
MDFASHSKLAAMYSPHLPQVYFKGFWRHFLTPRVYTDVVLPLTGAVWKTG